MGQPARNASRVAFGNLQDMAAVVACGLPVQKPHSGSSGGLPVTVDPCQCPGGGHPQDDLSGRLRCPPGGLGVSLPLPEQVLIPGSGPTLTWEGAAVKRCLLLRPGPEANTRARWPSAPGHDGGCCRSDWQVSALLRAGADQKDQQPSPGDCPLVHHSV